MNRALLALLLAACLSWGLAAAAGLRTEVARAGRRTGDLSSVGQDDVDEFRTIQEVAGRAASVVTSEAHASFARNNQAGDDGSAGDAAAASDADDEDNEDSDEHDTEPESASTGNDEASEDDEDDDAAE